MPNFISNAFIALAISLGISVLITPILIPYLRRLKVGQNIREDGPASHFSKAGTPTMGGFIIITAVMLSSFILAANSAVVLSALLVLLAFGGIGFWDDYIKVVLKRSLGLRARGKLGLQLLFGLAFALLLVFYLDRGTDIIIPFSGQIIDIGFWYIPFVVLVLIGTSNAVNLTDGLDGLATGVTFFVAIAFATICVITANYELLIFAVALIGACLGFWFFNKNPAKVFMGDTGSMALGGAVAAMAAITKTELFLVIIGGIYVMEALSVIIQVISFQATRKRIFLMSPIHHHFELKGWSENKVLIIFSFITIFLSIIAVYNFYSIF